MARVQNTLIGKSSGSVGGTTFTTWKGINVLKSKALTVANPQTDKQTMRRSAFTQAVEIYRLISQVVDAGFVEQAVKKSAYNAFISDILDNGFNYSAPPAATLEPTGVKIAKGTISPDLSVTTSLDTVNDHITFDWVKTPLLPGQSLTDVPIMAAHNVTQDEWCCAIGSASRDDETDDLPCPADWLGTDTYVGYLAFINEDGSKASDSVYYVVSP